MVDSSRPDLKRLGGELRARRLSQGLSLRTVAARAGWHRSVVEAVERGDPTHLLALVDVAAVLGTRVQVVCQGYELAV